MHIADAGLTAVASTVDLLRDLGVDLWLAGGWAVDFHYGEVTRSHSDVDVVVYHSDKDLIHRGLISDGFLVLDDSDPDAEMIYEKNGVKVDLSFITVRPDGATVTPGWEHWPWPPGSFTDTEVQLAGVKVRCVSAETLLTSKTGWEVNVGEAPRARDLSDIERLQGILQDVDRA